MLMMDEKQMCPFPSNYVARVKLFNFALIVGLPLWIFSKMIVIGPFTFICTFGTSERFWNFIYGKPVMAVIATILVLNEFFT